MGKVYAATNVHTDVEVALKVVREDLCKNEEVVRRFFEEARAPAQVRHPGIVRVFDVGHEEGRVWVAMELLSGESLASRLKRGVLRGDELTAIFTQLLQILKRVHAAGMVHRDLKPASVFLEQPPTGKIQVRLLDFGIAKLSDSRHGPQVVSEGASVPYLAPEQMRRARDVDQRADIYALGVMLYRCITGHLPYQAGSFRELVAKHFSSAPIPLPERLDPRSRAYGELALACLSIDPTRRPADIAALEPLFHRASMLEAVEPVPARIARRHGRTVLAVGAVLVISLGTIAVRRAAHGTSARGAQPVPPPSSLQTPVEVLVRTDIPGGQLLVDGASRGGASDGRWVLQLAPGAHQLAIRVGASVISSSPVTVREGVPATVLLSMPEGVDP